MERHNMSTDQKTQNRKYINSLPNRCTVLMQFLSQSQQNCFIDIGKLIWNFSWKGSKTRITETVLQTNESGSNQSAWFQDV